MEISNYLLQCTSAIVSAHVSKNPGIKTKDLPEIISSIFLTLKKLASNKDDETNITEPAVAVSESVTPDYIVCLEDGKKLKMLKRHLKTFYNLSLDDYRRKWGLPEDYPVVAPNYAKTRSNLARNMGLGKKVFGNDDNNTNEIN